MKQNLQKRLRFVLFGLIILSPILIITGVGAETEAATGGYAGNWTNEVKLTSVTRSAERPVIKGAPNGSTVIIVFNQKMNDTGTNYDPYYMESTNNGESWSAPAVIKASSEISVNVFVAYSSDNKAHVVWSEDDNKIYYSQKTGSSWSTPIKINQYTPVVADTPQIFISGTTIDVVWSQQNAAPPNAGVFDIYHSRCTTSCTNPGNWTAALTPVAQTSFESFNPSLYAKGNTIHVVWGEADPTPTSHIDSYYIISTNGGSTWSPQAPTAGLNLSDPDNDDDDADGADNGRIPQITVANNRIHVTFTELKDDLTSQQFVHYVTCSIANSDSNCTNKDNWVSYGSISDQVLGANDSTPFNVISTAVMLRNCVIVFYHGTLNGITTAKEQIFESSSCSQGSWGNRQELTSASSQALRPKLEVHANWFVYGVFDVVDGTGKSQIWFIKNQPALFMPILIKGN
jgi:hypothetical protein